MLGQQIKDLRNKLGLTQQTVADRVNVDVTTISKIENGRANPSLPTLKSIAKALEANVSDLLGEQSA